MPHNTEEIRLAYKSKNKLNRENQVILWMITDGKRCHYLAIKRLSTLLRRIASNHYVDFYCFNCLHPYGTKGKIKKHENVCKDHDYC